MFQHQINKLNRNLLSKYLALFCISSFLFLSHFELLGFYFKYLILILILPSISYEFNNVKNKKFKNILIYTSVTLILIFQSILNTLIYKNEIEFYHINSILFFIFLLVITNNYFDLILKNIEKIIIIFFMFFFVSIFISFFNFKPGNPFFCGGIPNVFPDYLNLKSIYAAGIDDGKNIKISFKEFLFKENSHLGIIAPSIIFFFFYKFNKCNNFFFYSSLFFLLVVIIKSSTTTLISLLICGLLFTLFYKNKFNVLPKIMIFFLVSMSFLTLSLTEECFNRTGFTFEKFSHQIKKIPKLNKNLNNEIGKNLYEPKSTLKNLDNMNNYNEKVGYNLSNSIFRHNLNLTYWSITENPFGWGINRYNLAADEFVKHLNLDEKNSKYAQSLNFVNYNKMDGSNNFFKIIVELGVLGIFFYCFVIIFFFSKKVNFEYKVFLIPFVISQCFRAAGYFNSGFILVTLLMVITYFNIKNYNGFKSK